MQALIKLLLASKKFLAALGILFLGVAGCNLLVATKPDIPPRPKAPDVRIVSSINVVVQTNQPLHKAFGVVDATRTADLRFNISGEVATVHPAMKNGTLVRAGDTLAQLDDELLLLNKQDIAIQIAAEVDNLKELENQLALRQSQFDRVTSMAAASVASERRLDEAKLALSMAKAAMRQSMSRRDQLTVKLKQIERNIADSRLSAPFDGVLSSVTIGEGRVVSSQNVLGLLTDLNSLEVSFIVPSEIYANSRSLVGQTVEVVWTSGGRDVKTVNATIARSEGLIKASEGGGRLYATLPTSLNSPESIPPQTIPPHSIPPGAFVEIRYPSMVLEDIIILPDTALYDNDNVFVIENGMAVERAIEVISKTDGQIYVRGDLRDGEQVIITRLPGLGEGVRVRVVGS